MNRLIEATKTIIKVLLEKEGWISDQKYHLQTKRGSEELSEFNLVKDVIKHENKKRHYKEKKTQQNS